MDIVIFGAGLKGQEAMQILREEGNTICGFLDNDESKWGCTINGVQVISPQMYIENNHSERIILGSIYKYQVEMENQLKELGITNYEFFDRKKVYKKTRLITYCSPRELEDVILYHLLKNEDDIFYIDVGSNDPFNGSVTKLLYDMKRARGINIEPQPWLCKLTEMERPRDITICTAVGKEEGKLSLYVQDGGSTFCKENVIVDNCDTIDVDVVRLSSICDKYLDGRKSFSFLKIDVEGFEKEVLNGMDFEKYRPKIIVMESTIPRTEDFVHDEWEDILITNKYTFVYTRGVNRYYIADEVQDEYQEALSTLDNVESIYHVVKAQLTGA